jgi:sensor domain CHASE-containing protein
MGSVQIWQLGIAIVALVGGWLTSYNILKERVIRLEEQVKNLHDNHTRIESLIKDTKSVIDKIWERLERKVDK